MGVATAATSSVIVTTHVVSSRGASRRAGSSACSGTTSVNMNAELRPAKASAATMAQPGVRRVSLSRDPGDLLISEQDSRSLVRARMVPYDAP
jgi:hypothetical protein